VQSQNSIVLWLAPRVAKETIKEGHMAQVTSELHRIATFITAIIDVVFVTLLAWRIRK
jgi:hypothetical protein